jgi:hypothetical protein
MDGEAKTICGGVEKVGEENIELSCRLRVPPARNDLWRNREVYTRSVHTHTILSSDEATIDHRQNTGKREAACVRRAARGEVEVAVQDEIYAIQN